MIGNCDNCDRTNVPVSTGACSSGETTQCYICQGDVADPFCEMLVDADWLRRKTETDPDLDCEVRPSVLAETIRTKLLGVAPEDQDVVLEDNDWRMILSALAAYRNYCPRASWCAPVVDDCMQSPTSPPSL